MRKYLLFQIIVTSLIYFNCSDINTITGDNNVMYTNIGDEFLNEQIKVNNIKVTESNNSKVFNVKISNLMWFDMNIEVKMDFYDSEGIKQDNPWGWKPLTIEQGQSDWVKFIAPNKRVQNFKLYVKKASD